MELYKTCVFSIRIPVLFKYVSLPHSKCLVKIALNFQICKKNNKFSVKAFGLPGETEAAGEGEAHIPR